MGNIEMSLNEQDLINMFNKDQLKEMIELNIKAEYYEAIPVIQSAIDQYDECGPFENYISCGVDVDEIDGIDFHSN